MTVRVRFAPSPTGYLHIGGARTALYNFLYAKAVGGTFVLRIEDTDLERSKREYEEKQIEDLKWLGIDYDEGPDRPGEYGPYRQSERTEIYQKYAQQLLDKGLAYYDFCSDEELDAMRERAQKEGRPPHYDGKWRDPQFADEARERIAAGESAAIRFRAPKKSYVLNDKVRGRIVYPENMVGDFVIMRSNGLPVYNFCVVIDDMEMKISHVIRGEDHLSNTLRQMMVFEALESDLPEFAHVSLLIGKDRQKLSKRHGATSVTLYKDETYLPQALANYLCLLGWSHPDEKDIFELPELYSLFNLERFSKSPAIYDIDKLKWMNGMHIRKLPFEEMLSEVKKHVSNDHFFFQQSTEWQQKCMELFGEQIEFFGDLEKVLNENLLSTTVDRQGEVQDILSWETTPKILDYLGGELNQASETFVAADTFAGWTNAIKKELGIKGKQLFKGVRLALTGRPQGPELKDLVPLTPVSVLKERIEALK